MQDGKQEFWITSLHLHWPWPFKQQAQLEDILMGLSQLKGRKIVAGDFNMVKWSTKIREMNAFLETKSVNETNNSFFFSGNNLRCGNFNLACQPIGTILNDQLLFMHLQ